MKNNAFGALRMLAAVLVTFSHSFSIAGGETIKEPPYPLFDFSFGTIGVYLFFAISGILVTKSWIESKSAIHFATYRISRIYPALLACLLISVLVIGPLFTSRTATAYFQDRDIYEHILHNGSLLFPMYSSLPGIFELNPVEFGINGSLWTLPWEMRAYAALLVGGLVFGLKRGWKGGALLLIGVMLGAEWMWPGSKEARFLLAFFVGGLLYQMREILFQRRYWVLLVATVVAAALYGRPYFEYAFVVWTAVMAYAVGFSQSGSFSVLERNDLSYGLYLYSYPVGQMLVSIFGITNPVLLFVATAAMAGMLAVASWHLIEKPILARKKVIADALLSWQIAMLNFSWRK